MSSSVKFEYKTTYQYRFLDDDTLNDYGNEGWELTGFVVDRYGNYRYIFKREKYD